MGDPQPRRSAKGGCGLVERVAGVGRGVEPVHVAVIEEGVEFFARLFGPVSFVLNQQIAPLDIGNLKRSWTTSLPISCGNHGPRRTPRADVPRN